MPSSALLLIELSFLSVAGYPSQNKKHLSVTKMSPFLVLFGAKDITDRLQATDLWAQDFRSTSDSSAKWMNINKTIFDRFNQRKQEPVFILSGTVKDTHFR